MRQVGILAAGALYALGNHRSRLVEDHEHAKLFARELRGAIENTRASALDPETNIVNIDVPTNVAPQVAAAAKENGVLLGAIGPSRLRAVFHLEISRDASVTAAQALAQAIRAICSVD
jgi:threonine aldolase